MNIPIAINIITKNDIIFKTLIGTDLNDCLNKIIIELKIHFDMTIDYPVEYDDFESIYLNLINDVYCDTKKNYIFDYKIYDNNEWKKPWNEQEIYELIINLINAHDIQELILNPITYSDEI